jgi:hypothetical protein
MLREKKKKSPINIHNADFGNHKKDANAAQLSPQQESHVLSRESTWFLKKVEKTV